MASCSRRPCRSASICTRRSKSAASRPSGAHRLRGHRLPFPGPLDGRRQPARLDRFEQVIDGVHLEGVDRVLVEGRDEDHLGVEPGLHDPPRHFEPGQPRHLDVEHHQVRLVFFDYVQRLDSVSRLADDLDAAELLEQETQLVARQLLVVDDDRAQDLLGGVGAPGIYAISLAGDMRISGMTIRAQVPWPGTLSSCSW